MSFGHAAARRLTAGPSAPAPCAIQHGPRLALRGSPRATPPGREGSGSGAIPGPGCWSEGELHEMGGAAGGRTLRPRACRRDCEDPTSGPLTAGMQERRRAAPRCTSRFAAHGQHPADARPECRGSRTRTEGTGAPGSPAHGAAGPRRGVQGHRVPGPGAPPLAAGCAPPPTASRGCRAAGAEGAGSWIDCLP